MSGVRIAVNKHGHSSDLSSRVSVQQGGGGAALQWPPRIITGCY